MKLTLVCDHGTRTVEFDEGREGIGNVQSLAGQRSFAAQVVAEVTPRCPYCEQVWGPLVVVGKLPPEAST